METITVFGPSWLEVDGVAYLLQKTFTSCDIKPYYTLASLFNHMNIHPNERIILTVQPHAYAYLLYQVTLRCPNAHITVLANKFYFSDKVILETLNLSGVSFEDFIRFQHAKILNLPTNKPHKLPFHNKDMFISYINHKILNHLVAQGLSLSQKKVLTLLVRGYSNAKVSRLMNISNKTVSTHKINGLMKLPHPKDRFALSRGLQASEQGSLTAAN